MRSQDCNIELKLVEGHQRRVQESLLAGDVEFAFLYEIDLSDELFTEAMTELTPYVLLAEGHELVIKTALAPEDLADQPMILLDVAPSRDYFPDILRRRGVEPNITLKSSSFEMVRGMVGHGLGYTLLATKPASGMTYDGRALITRPLKADVEPSQVMLAHRKGVKLSSAGEAFLAHCHEFFDLVS